MSLSWLFSTWVLPPDGRWGAGARREPEAFFAQGSFSPFGKALCVSSLADSAQSIHVSFNLRHCGVSAFDVS